MAGWWQPPLLAVARYLHDPLTPKGARSPSGTRCCCSSTGWRALMAALSYAETFLCGQHTRMSGRCRATW